MTLQNKKTVDLKNTYEGESTLTPKGNQTRKNTLDYVTEKNIHKESSANQSSKDGSLTTARVSFINLNKTTS